MRSCEIKHQMTKNLLTGSAKNWYRQLSRSTRNKWSDLLHSFQIQYCGLGVSVARQYYHTRGSDESPLDYLHRLNVAGLRARLKIKDGSAKDRREHVDHYLETLEDQDLSELLTLLQLKDVDDLEEGLPAWDRAKNHQKKAAFGSGKYRQKTANTTPSAPAKQVPNDSGSDSDIDSHRRIFLAANEDVTPKVEKESTNRDPRLLDRDHGHQDRNSKIHGNGFNRGRCFHCGSKKHSDLGCWRCVTCTKCDKRGHPSDHCLFVCRGCGELHDMGKCPMEEFYNQIRQYCIYAFVNKTSVDQVSKRPDLHGNTCDLHGKHTFAISSLRQVDEYARSEVTMSVDL
ncbi:hypothetical protein PHMEG_00033456 [Phytophthora megakarya]|uniref:CCHC-type domain-containing protein n=1 Tax=Phytophthora megakarya TaxID=4795 RepID=A0A225UTJ3_9STRA|nr:hypothetical protein PHMEG_00033456 [Phytophthora megakarya]